jgi:hypothetical protein
VARKKGKEMQMKKEKKRQGDRKEKRGRESISSKEGLIHMIRS